MAAFHWHRHACRRLGCSALALTFVAASSTRTVALDPDRTLAQIHHTAWTAEDGAPSQISAITQTADGYLWIGSARGLFRFDGVTFEHYAPPDSVRLPSHNTYALATTPDGDLWISFRPYGIGHLRNGRLTTFDGPGEKQEVFTLACGLDGRVYAGTREGLFIHTGNRWAALGADWNLPAGRVQCLFADRDGLLWVAGGGQVNTLAPGSTEFVLAGNAEWVANMSQGPDGVIWSTQIDHVTTIAGPRTGSSAPGVIHQPSNQVLVDRDGCLWITTPGEGVQRVRVPDELKGQDAWPGDPRIESIRAAHGLSDDAVHVLFEDREGNIWAGTAKGIDQFRHNHMVPVTVPHGYQAFTLMPDDDGAIWVGCAKGRELLRVSAEKVEALNIEMAAGSACRDKNGVIWWGVVDRIVRQEGRDFRSYPLFDTPNQEWLWEVFSGGLNGLLWVSVGDMGLYQFREGDWRKAAPADGLPREGPCASFLAADGRSWLGYGDNRVCVLNGGRAQTYTQANGIDIGRVRVIRGRGERIWVGGELGLALFDNGRFRTVACAGAEPFGTVAGIIATADGSLWLNELRGVVHIPADEIERFVRDPTHAVGFRRYDVKEGLPGAGQMNWNCSTAAEASDGKLWFATDGGLAWIDPARITTNSLPPPVIVQSITTEDGAFHPGGPIRLANRTATLRIDYTALSLSIPEQVRFRYRLEGYDREWIDVGSRRAAFYTRLRPGSYRFQVAAANNDGIWNRAGAAVAFSIAPAFYQTGWFAGASLLGIVSACWLAYRTRVRQVATRLQRLHDERMDERMRIAHELHDTLLQGFLSASMQLHVAREAIPEDSSAKKQVGRVLNIMDGVIGDARLAVRGLRVSESAELEQSFARIPQEAGTNGQAELRILVDGRLRPLQPTAHDEVYRIGRESIMNAFRHSGARTIEAEITYRSRELRLVVRDDGRGIDEDVLREGRDGHWGLSGMRERAKRMDGQLTVRSRPGSGTEIELVVPGRVAFIDPPPANVVVRFARWLSGRGGAARQEE